MSKEQTPITAEEFILHSGYEECCDYLPPSKISPLMEQFAQAKVLEALEKENLKNLVNTAYGRGFADGYMRKPRNKDYFKTEVKPNYEKKNS